jgi:hypothetical protein
MFCGLDWQRPHGPRLVKWRRRLADELVITVLPERAGEEALILVLATPDNVMATKEVTVVVEGDCGAEHDERCEGEESSG